MLHQQAKFSRSRATRVITAVGSILILSTAVTAPAEARGAHGVHHEHRSHERHASEGSGPFAGDRHHGNDAYAKATSEEEDKLLNTRIKSICCGC
jgi:hypothetical protein